MSITAAVKKGYPRGGTDTDRGPEYEVRYVVTATDASIGPLAVLTALPITLGSVYAYGAETDLSVLCRKIGPAERTGPLTWEVPCTFNMADEANPSQNPEGEPNPFLRPPDISWTHDDHQDAVSKAWRLEVDDTWTPDQVAVVNSAGGAFANPLMRDRARLVLKYTRNERIFPLGHAQTFQDTINAGTFLGWAVGCVLCKHIDGSWTAEQVEEVWLRYWRVSYEFVFNRDTWIESILDSGNFYRDTRYVVGDPPVDNPNYWKISAVRDKDGVPMHGPFLLDLFGGLLSDTQVEAGDLKHRRFSYREMRDFSPMQITIPY
jgi:hypothetical protein